MTVRRSHCRSNTNAACAAVHAAYAAMAYGTASQGNIERSYFIKAMLNNTDPGISERGEILQSKSPDVSLPPKCQAGQTSLDKPRQAYHGNPLC